METAVFAFVMFGLGVVFTGIITVLIVSFFHSKHKHS